MNALFYIPTSLNSPEFEILLSKTQNFINERKKVTILTCSGGKDYSCSINIYSNPLICSLCNKEKSKGFNKIKGKFKLIKTDRNLKQKKFNLKNVNQLKSFKFNGVDIGLSSYSSYLANTKDHKLEGKISTKVLLKNINTTLNLYEFFSTLIEKENFDIGYAFNGRQNQYRPLLRLLVKNKIKTIILEYRGPEYTNVYEYINHLPTDYHYQAYKIEQNFKKLKIRKSKMKYLVNYYFRSLKLGKKIQDKVSYVEKQKDNLLPEDFKKEDENIVIFNSSEDEYASLGEIYDNTIYKSQIDALKNICRDLSKTKKKIIIWLRIHPNLRNVKWSYIKEFFDLESKYKFLHVISASSEVSSYALLFNSSKVITFGSNMGIEAVYNKKPAILLNRIPYEKLKCQYVPRSHKEVMKLIYSDLKPMPTLGVEKYALFKMIGGEKLKGFKGSYDEGFSFYNNKFKQSFLFKIQYYFCRFIDKYYFLYTRNAGIKLLIRSIFLDNKK